MHRKFGALSRRLAGNTLREKLQRKNIFSMETQIGERKRARDETKMEAENADGKPSLQTRGGRRTLQSQRSRSGRLSHSTCLLDFAPDLMSKFSSSECGENHAHVRVGKHTTKESPLRSPLHTTQRGFQETTPHRGRHASHSSGNNGAKQRGCRIRSSDVSKPPQDENAAHCQSNDRRVRKCLWAEEVEDEAFCEGEDLSDEPVTAREPPKTPTKEQLTRRQKDIDYGKATVGYKNYLERVPKEQRGNLCPQTPDKHSKVPRRTWDVGVRNWRRALHNWDVPSKQSAYSTPSSSPTKVPIRQGEKTLGRGEGMSPVSSITSSPSDRGYVTTPDSKCDLSSLDLDEEDFWLEAMEQFPPLPSAASGQKKPWWQTVEEEEAKVHGVEKVDEEDHLNQYVGKLKIGLQEEAEEGKEKNVWKQKRGENQEDNKVEDKGKEMK